MQIDHLFYRYGQVEVLSNITLSLKRGGFYLIIGPNGGGKTTFLKLLMGFLTPQFGSIQIFGKSPIEMRSQMGYVPQSFLFDPLFPLTVEEFVLMGHLSKLTWYGKFPREVKQKATEWMDILGVLSFRKEQIGKVSGGQRQRAALARALLCDPEILILDEPTTGLDTEAAYVIDERLRALKGKKTVLMVSHHIPNFLDIVDEVICIRGTSEVVAKDTVCSHHALGVYHANFTKRGRLSE